MHGRKAVITVSGAMASVSPALAADNETAAFNLSSIGPMINEAAGIMPDMLTLLIGAGGLMIGAAVIGFVTGSFDKILDGMSFNRRR